jgi:predicted dehydrogenase
VNLRIGVLGAARIAPPAIVKPARAVDGTEVVAVAARDRARAERFARRHGIPTVHTSYDALLADPDVDAVYNPLPNGLHGHWTVRAVDAGKHVLCEKPFAANAAEARSVAAAVGGRGLAVMEAFHWRYHPLADRLLEIVGSGEIGSLRHVQASMLAPLPKRDDIRWQIALAGGSCMDMGCYPISFVRVATGEEPLVLRARAKERSPGIDRYLDADLTFPSGVTGRVVCGMWSGRGLDVRARIVGNAGEIRVLNPFAPQYFSRLVVRTSAGRRRERVVRTPTYEFQLRAFLHTVESGEEPLTGLAFAVANMAAVDACYEAAGLAPRTPTPVAPPGDGQPGATA